MTRGDLTDIRLGQSSRGLLLWINPCSLGEDFISELRDQCHGYIEGHIAPSYVLGYRHLQYVASSFAPSGAGESISERASPLTLALLEPRILLVDDVTLSLSDHDLAIRCLASNTAFNFHAFTRSSLSMPSLAIDNSTFRHVIRTQLDLDLVPWKDADVELPHSTADVCEDLLSVFQLDLKSSVRQCLGNNCIKGDLFFFGHAATRYTRNPYPLPGRVRVTWTRGIRNNFSSVDLLQYAG